MGAEVPGIPSSVSGRNGRVCEANAAIHDVSLGAELPNAPQNRETSGVDAIPDRATAGLPDHGAGAEVGGEFHQSEGGHVSLASRELHHGSGVETSGNGGELDAKEESGGAVAGEVGREVAEEEEEEDEEEDDEEDDEDDVLEALDWVDLREGGTPYINNDNL